MTNLFVSTYIGDKSNEYLKQVSKLGIKDIFTSLHIPEQNLNVKIIYDHLDNLNKLGFKNIICDISKNTFKYITSKELKKFKVTTLRIDFGLTEKEIINLQKEGFLLALNASTITNEELNNFDKLKLNKDKVMFIHNYYPNEYTGLSKDFVSNQNKLIHKYGYKLIAGFIVGTIDKRLPLKYGLPTIEETRHLKEYESYQIANQYFDLVGIGDNVGDIIQIKKILTPIKEPIGIDVKSLSKINLGKESTLDLLNKQLTIRKDSGEYIYRVFETRGYASINNVDIKPKLSNAVKGDIIIFNNNSKRYVGEIALVRKNIKNNKLFNVIGKISDLPIEDISGFKIKLIKK